MVQLKIYLLLHQAQFGSMENYTKVKLNWIIHQSEIQSDDSKTIVFQQRVQVVTSASISG